MNATFRLCAATTIVVLCLGNAFAQSGSCFVLVDENCRDCLGDLSGVSCGNLCGDCDPEDRICDCDAYLQHRNNTRAVAKDESGAECGQEDWELAVEADGVTVDDVLCGVFYECNSLCYMQHDAYGHPLGFYRCTTPNTQTVSSSVRCSKHVLTGAACGPCP